MRNKLIAGNWKMNGGLAANRALIAAVLNGVSAQGPVAAVEYAICAPFPYLSQLADLLSGSTVAWGAQDVSEYVAGAYTGETSAGMLKDFACRYVIVGHSERRTLFGDTDARVAAKFVQAKSAGLTPILCVGETLEERESGQTMAVVSRQIEAVLSAAGPDAFAGAVIAYEPVWAIGTGRTASPAQAQEVHAAIRAQVAESNATIAVQVKILYGGSMKPQNAAELLALKDVDGGLIGGAALVAADFLAIGAAGQARVSA
jgi:triosephosphate isomerase